MDLITISFYIIIQMRKVMLCFWGVAKKLREAGLFDLADMFERNGQRMATRNRAVEL